MNLLRIIACENNGAGDASEFAPSWPKTVAATLETQVDVLGVIEMATDGYGPDTFLIKIWNSATDAVVYDTKPGVADSANPKTVLKVGRLSS